MLYRFQKYSRMRRFSYAIREVFRTPPVEVKEAPWCIVSMVANGDVAMYLLAIKSFYPKLGRGKVAAIIDRDMPQALRDTLARHVIGLEFVILEHIPTGACQRGGTWERLLYVLDRSEREYTIQLDSDTLTVSDDVDEVVHCLEVNTCVMSVAHPVLLDFRGEASRAWHLPIFTKKWTAWSAHRDGANGAASSAVQTSLLLTRQVRSFCRGRN